MSSPLPHLGIRANLPQFSLLVLINGFVGAMVGLERTILPLIAEREFGIPSKTIILSFLVSFGIVKAFSNLLAGRFSEKIGRRNVLLAGWLFGLPVPFLLIFARSWDWVVLANLLLGVNQGLCWSATVIMKIDLAGPRQRGLAMGLNEFSGYLSVALAAYFSATLAAEYGLRPYPFSLGIGFSATGFLLSFLMAKETSGHADVESIEAMNQQQRTGPITALPEGVSVEQLPVDFRQIFLRTSWKNKTLFSCSQAGLVNNLNDGAAWGLFPLFFAARGLNIEQVGFLAAIYPGVWGTAQLISGALSDRLGRKWMIVLGMWMQATAIIALPILSSWASMIGAMFLLGIGTAMVYPTLLAAVSDATQPSWRASAVGVYRLWRDLGYAIGAILSGLIADSFGIPSAVVAVGGLTFFSGILVALKMKEKMRKLQFEQNRKE